MSVILFRAARDLGYHLIEHARATRGKIRLTGTEPPGCAQASRVARAQAGGRVSTSKPTRVRRSRLNSMPMR